MNKNFQTSTIYINQFNVGELIWIWIGKQYKIRTITTISFKYADCLISESRIEKTIKISIQRRKVGFFLHPTENDWVLQSFKSVKNYIPFFSQNNWWSVNGDNLLLYFLASRPKDRLRKTQATVMRFIFIRRYFLTKQNSYLYRISTS